KRIKMDENTLVALGVQTFKITLLLSLPMLLAGLIAGLVISIFQATTQINEMTLSFVPKIILVVVILIFLMPWMTTTMIDFTENILNQIPTFIK
ncbi:flagellar biosynthesis protein FliQ, partial [Klebsiella pneumoniae]